MKRKLLTTLCFVLCVAMALCQVCTAAEITDYTLREKMQRQVEAGSGIKGSASVQAEGTADFLKWLIPLNGRDIQLRKIDADGLKETRIYTADGETECDLVRLYEDEEKTVLTSGILENKKILIPSSMWKVNQWNQPAWYLLPGKVGQVSSLVWKAQWQEAAAPLEEVMESWIEKFATAPAAVRDENGQTVINMEYHIPMKNVKDELSLLIENLFSEKTLLTLIKDLATDDEASAYLDEGKQEEYKAKVMNLPDEGNIDIFRVVSAQGDVRSTDITLPLRSVGDFTSLKLSGSGFDREYTLSGASKTVQVKYSTDDEAKYAGTFSMIPNDVSEENMGFAAAFTMEKVQTKSVDEDGTTREITDISMEIAPAADQAEENSALDFSRDFMPFAVNLHMEMSSKNSPSASTKVDYSLGITSDEADAKVTGQLKTASPWTIVEVSDENGISLENVSKDGRKELQQSYLTALTSSVAHE